ncbi:MAG: mechanosensitive ion channel family protein [Candidatus Fibromonas sp.]|jgi:small-conductance mechanosensitive channel|nr:mechanosensitive ion channel family protein [Candidatus Fibromonas sp.]
MEKLLALFDSFVETENGIYFLGNSLWHWMLALAITIAAYFLFRLVFKAIVKQIDKIANRTESVLYNIIVDALKNSKFWFFAVIAVFFGTTILNLGEYEFIPLQILILTAFVQIGIWLNVIFNDILGNWSKKNNPNAIKNAGFTIISGLGKFLIWAVILLLILDNLGVKVFSLMAGLGVGGIAVALAVQRILGDLFASISIMIDKPFEIGDFIAIGDIRGTVESIGIKTTRIRSITGEQIIISNSDLLDSRVSNFKRMLERRITFTFGVTYQTAKESLHKITDLVKNIIEAQSGSRFDRGHLKGFDASSIEYEFVYWVTSPNYVAYMDVQQKINLAVIDAFAERKIELARPTQTVFLQK